MLQRRLSFSSRSLNLRVCRPWTRETVRRLSDIYLGSARYARLLIIFLDGVARARVPPSAISSLDNARAVRVFNTGERRMKNEGGPGEILGLVWYGVVSFVWVGWWLLNKSVCVKSSARMRSLITA